jgi:Starch-binding associating with outer membrane
MKKIFIYLLIFLGFSMSCTKDFEDFNKDTKNPAEVKGEFLVSRAQKELMDQTTNSNVNLNIFKLIAQYWTETTYTDEANYDLVNRTIPNGIYGRYYRWILKPLAEAKMLITNKVIATPETEASRTNELMIIELLEVFAYQNLVNIFGGVPYTEAVDFTNVNPAYDDAATIYADLIARTTAAVAALDVSAQDGTTFAFGGGGQEFFYGADVASWITFGNSLKLKLGIMLADVAGSNAQATVEAAVTAGVMTSAADDALFPYGSSTPNTNAMYEDLILSGRKDFVVANTIVDLMKDLADPRMDTYFSYQLDTAGDGTMEYVGALYGHSSAYANHSHVGAILETPNFPGIMMTYYEVLFYMAEAAERGWNVGMTAQAAYEAAVTASFEWWGLTAADATAYLATPGADYTAAADAMDLIGTQAYIAYYTRGLVAWNTYRKFDVPQMNVPPGANTPNGEVPTRFFYPISEQTLNADNYAAAVTAIGGSDDMVTLLFWDVAAPAK